MGPGISAVHGNIDGDVSDQADSFFICISLQLHPLFIKFILHILLKFNLKIQFSAVIVHGIAPAQADIL